MDEVGNDLDLGLCQSGIFGLVSQENVTIELDGSFLTGKIISRGNLGLLVSPEGNGPMQIIPYHRVKKITFDAESPTTSLLEQAIKHNIPIF